MTDEGAKPKGELVPFGKHRGKPVAELIADTGAFGMNTKIKRKITLTLGLFYSSTALANQISLDCFV